MLVAKIWDTAGQERFRMVGRSFYRQAQGIVLVFDVTNRESYKSIESWITNINSLSSEGIPKYLVANKIDMGDERKVSREEGEEIARQYEMEYIETSAKEDIGIKHLIQRIIMDASLKAITRDDTIHLTARRTKGQLNCCL